jgi:hypothetical protein
MTWLTFAVGLALGVVVGVWADRTIRAFPARRKYSPIREKYKCVDEVLGATKTENQKRADLRFEVIHRRRWWWWFVPRKSRLALANYFWPVPQIGTGMAALPTEKTMGTYVEQVGPGDYWLRYTSEVAANRPVFLEYLIQGHPTKGGGLAQALGLPYEPGMFAVEWDRPNSRVRLTLNHKTEMPTTAATRELV